MPAGRLRNRVIFQRETQTPDEGGGHSVAWGSDLELWAEFYPERSSERIDAGRVASPLAGTLRVRWSPVTKLIHEGDRVEIDGKLFNIRSIADETMRRQFLTMTVESGVAI
jgi:SPP1 family predicted phage head-tail adaptor